MNLQPMTEDEYATYRATSEEEYARDIAGSGMLTPEGAREKARADYARLLTDGRQTPGHHLLTAYADGVVGLIWLHLEGQRGFIYDIKVRPELRGAGHGRAIMLAAEGYAKERGVTTLGLNVFGQNTVARRLYESLDYRVLSVQMRKEL